VSMPYCEPLALLPWVEEHKHLLVPPVCNKLVYGAGMWKAMVVGGPNARADYHIEEGEEFFLQLTGKMCLKVMERGVPRDIIIEEGQMFMLPARIPHSPNRYENTVGLVMERERIPGEMDGLRWYTPEHDAVLYEEWFHCTDLGRDLKPVIERFNSSEAKKTGVPRKDDAPPPVIVDEDTELSPPVKLVDWIEAARGMPDAPPCCEGTPLFPGANHAFCVDVYWGQCSGADRERRGEVMLFQQRGSAHIQLTTADSDDEETRLLRQGELLMLPEGTTYRIIGQESDCTGLEFYIHSYAISPNKRRMSNT